MDSGFPNTSTKVAAVADELRRGFDLAGFFLDFGEYPDFEVGRCFGEVNVGLRVDGCCHGRQDRGVCVSDEWPLEVFQ